MNICALCGGIKFHSFVVYQDHMMHTHAVRIGNEVRPLKTTNRTKAEIVEAVEVRFNGHLVEPYCTQLHDDYVVGKVVLHTDATKAANRA